MPGCDRARAGASRPRHQRLVFLLSLLAATACGDTSPGALDDGGAGLDGGGPDRDGATPDGGPSPCELDCTSLDDTCVVGVCDPEARACSAMPRDDGIACGGGSACGTGLACSAGECTVTAAPTLLRDGDVLEHQLGGDAATVVSRTLCPIEATPGLPSPEEVDLVGPRFFEVDVPAGETLRVVVTSEDSSPPPLVGILAACDGGCLSPWGLQPSGGFENSGEARRVVVVVGVGRGGVETPAPRATAGLYRVEVHVGPAPANLCATPTPLHVGDELIEGDPRRGEAWGSAGGATCTPRAVFYDVIVPAERDAVVTVEALDDWEPALVAVDDCDATCPIDTRGTYSGRIERLRIANTTGAELHQRVAVRAVGLPTGSFRIRVDERDPSGNISCATARALVAGSPLEAEGGDATPRYYRFEVPARQRAVVGTNGGFASVLLLDACESPTPAMPGCPGGPFSTVQNDGDSPRAVIAEVTGRTYDLGVAFADPAVPECAAAPTYDADRTYGVWFNSGHTFAFEQPAGALTEIEIAPLVPSPPRDPGTILSAGASLGCAMPGLPNMIWSGDRLSLPMATEARPLFGTANLMVSGCSEPHGVTVRAPPSPYAIASIVADCETPADAREVRARDSSPADSDVAPLPFPIRFGDTDWRYVSVGGSGLVRLISTGLAPPIDIVGFPVLLPTSGSMTIGTAGTGTDRAVIVTLSGFKVLDGTTFAPDGSSDIEIQFKLHERSGIEVHYCRMLTPSDPSVGRGASSVVGVLGSVDRRGPYWVAPDLTMEGSGHRITEVP